MKIAQNQYLVSKNMLINIFNLDYSIIQNNLQNYIIQYFNSKNIKIEHIEYNRNKYSFLIAIVYVNRNDLKPVEHNYIDVLNDSQIEA